jgi:hypothetical protein
MRANLTIPLTHKPPHDKLRNVPVVELLLAVPMLLWGGVMWTWFQARSAAVRFWTFVAATAGTTIPVIAIAALDEGTRSVVRGVFE